MDQFNLKASLTRLMIVSFCLILSSCTVDDDEVSFDNYVVSFDHIKSDTGVNYGSSDEIVWLDDSRFLSFAVVVNKNGQRSQGLYLNSNTGDARAIVDGIIGNFCIKEDRIFIQGHGGPTNIVGDVPNYKVKLVSNNKNRNTDALYSFLRCDFVSLPKRQPALYIPLKLEDGFLEITVDDERAWNSLNSAHPRPSFSKGQVTKQDFLRTKILELYRQSQLKLVWDLYVYKPSSDTRHKISGRWPAPPNLSYKEFSKSYFGYQDNRGLLSFWDLDIENERVRYDEFEYPEDFVRSGSRVIEPTKVGYILEYHSQKRGGLFLIADGELTLLKKGTFRNVSVAPDGCHIAYGEGDILRYKKDKLDYRQTVKIANVCAYMNSRKRLNDSNER